jgi:hypothetical protein
MLAMPWYVVVLARILETIFVVGSIGSFLVLVLTAIEDVKTLLGMDEEEKAVA